MRRRVARFLLLLALGATALVLGVVTAMTLTPPGRDLLTRTVVKVIDRSVLGRVEIGSIGGSFVRDLSLRQVTIRDTSGLLLASVPRIRVGFQIPQFIAGRIVFTRVTLEAPEVHITKWRSGLMNYEEIFRLGGPGTPGSRPPLVQLFDVDVHDAMVRVAVPWDPPRTARTARQRDSALAADRALPGRLIVAGRDGLQRVLTFANLSTRLPYVLVSSPDRKPLTVRIDSLELRSSDPPVQVVDAAGQVELRNDSLTFQFERLQLPSTFAVGGGVVSWPHDTLLYDFSMNAPSLDLADLLWIVPGFPPYTGRASVIAKSETPSRAAFTVSDLTLLGAGGDRIDGSLVAVVDAKRGLGVRRLDLQLTNVDLAYAKPFLPTLPFQGRLSGHTRADGLLTSLDADVDWTYADAQVAGKPISRVSGAGHLTTSPATGLAFQEFTVRSASIDLGTVRRFAPAVPLDGDLYASGTLDGAITNATFVGTVRHRDGDLPTSTADGRFGLDTRGNEPRFDIEADMDVLAFDGIRKAFPALMAQGSLAGHVRVEGTPARLGVSADVHGQMGTIEGQGVVISEPHHLGAESLDLSFHDFDLATARGTGPSTSLAGSLIGSFGADSGAVPEGFGTIRLGPSHVGPGALDTLVLHVALQDGVITVDSSMARWAGLHASAAGTLGWARPKAGTIVMQFTADTLLALDSAVAVHLDMPKDTIADSHYLAGRARATVTIDGSLDSLAALADFDGEGLEFRRWRMPTIAGRATWVSGPSPTLSLSARADSIRDGDLTFRKVAGDVRGTPDLLSWEAKSGVGDASTVEALGRLWPNLGPAILSIDTLSAALASHTWSLESPVAITLNDSTQAITPIALRTADGASSIDVVGRIPGTGVGGLSLGFRGIDLRDLYGLAQRDTSAGGGTITLMGEVGGTAFLPTIKGSLLLEGLRIGDARLPFTQGSLDYADRKLAVDLKLWRAGLSVFDVHAAVPFDLGWRGVGQRQVEGPLDVRAHTDSVDFAILEALTPAVRKVQGTLVADAQVDGTWKSPRLQGFAEVKNGGMTVVPLGTSFPSIAGRAELRGDSLTLDKVRVIGTRGGTLDVAGRVSFKDLAAPSLKLQLTANNFRAIDVKQFLALTATGNLKLDGPFFGATLTGNVTATDTDLYFADLISKRLFDVDDPSFADLADSASNEVARLKKAAPSRFFDALDARDLAVTIGSNAHLKSGEADIVIEGNLRANKQAKIYRFDGVLRAIRGRYDLSFNSGAGGLLLSREFTVDQGTVRYTGSPDLNAELDVKARHVVRVSNGPLSGQEVPVIAHITGTLYAPKVSLESDGDSKGLSEAELTQYLYFGGPAAQVFQNGGFLVATFANSLLGELVGSAGLPFDVLEVKVNSSTNKAAGQQVQFTVGKQLGAKTFLLGSTYFCQTQAAGTTTNFGATLQYRFNTTFRAQVGVEPRTQFCSLTTGLYNRTLINYQFGADVKYESEF